jgi:hypothetical protein
MAIGTIILVLTTAIVSAQNADITAGWSITFADGRVTTHVLKAKGGLWTPLFPKIEDISISPSGSAKYLDIRCSG